MTPVISPTAPRVCSPNLLSGSSSENDLFSNLFTLTCLSFSYSLSLPTRICSFIHSTNIYWVSVSNQRWRRQTQLSALWILQPGRAPVKDTLSLCGFCPLFFSSPSGLRVDGGRWRKPWNSRLSLWFPHSHPYLCNKPFLKPSSYHPNLSVPSVFCWNVDWF